MTNRFIYRLMYWLGMANWDNGNTPPEVGAAFRDADLPPGVALDLGCGTGANVIYMARQGRQALGVDFVPAAIARAREKAQQAGVTGRAQFHVGDVTRLQELDLPHCAFVLDMGCFHGLNKDGQRRYADSLAEILIPAGRFMLYTLDPRKQAGISFGVSPETVQAVFSPSFDVTRVSRGGSWGQRSTWFWMTKNDPT